MNNKVEYTGAFQTGGDIYRIIINHGDEQGRLIKRYEVWATVDAIKDRIAMDSEIPSQSDLWRFGLSYFENEWRPFESDDSDKDYPGIFVTREGVTRGDYNTFPGSVIQSDRMKRINVSIPRKLHDWLSKKSDSTGESISEIFRDSVAFQQEREVFLEKVPIEIKGAIDDLFQFWKLVDTTIYSSDTTTHSGSYLRHLLLNLNVLTMHKHVRGIVKSYYGTSLDNVDFVARSFVEVLINTAYVLGKDDDSRAIAFILDAEKDKAKRTQRLVDLMEQDKAPGMGDKNKKYEYIARIHAIQQQIDEIRSFHGDEIEQWPSLYDRAEKSGMAELYATVYWVLSLDSHKTVAGLSRYISEGESIDDLEYFDKVADDISLLSIRVISKAYFILVTRLNEELKIFNKTELEQFESKMLNIN